MDFCLTWFMLGIYTVGRDKKKSAKPKITYCICIVREQLNRHLCAQVYPHGQRLSWLTAEQPSLFCEAEIVKLSPKLIKKKVDETCRFTPKGTHAEVRIYTSYVLRNMHPLTTWPLLPSAYLRSNSCIVNKNYLSYCLPDLGKMPEEAIEIQLLGESR